MFKGSGVSFSEIDVEAVLVEESSPENCDWVLCNGPNGIDEVKTGPKLLSRDV